MCGPDHITVDLISLVPAESRGVLEADRRPQTQPGGSQHGRLLARQCALPQDSGARCAAFAGGAVLFLTIKTERLKQFTLTRSKQWCLLPCFRWPVTVLTESEETWARWTPAERHPVTTSHHSDLRNARGTDVWGFVVRLAPSGQREIGPVKTQRPAVPAQLLEVRGRGRGHLRQRNERTAGSHPS